MSESVKPIRGMNDVLPETTHRWQHVENTAREVLHSYGYREIRIPLLERTELFKRSIGEVTDIVEKEMYTFEDRKGASITLRPEATAGVVRSGISNGLLHNQKHRLWCSGPMFRYEKPQKGRYRQFHQIDVEALGYEGPDVDAELIIMVARIWRLLGITNMKLEINTVGTPGSRADYRKALVEYFSKYESELDQDSRVRLGKNPLRILDSKAPDMRSLIDGAPSMGDYLDPESRQHFAQLCDYLADAELDYTINPRLVRGLDYYSRTVFEWLTDELGSQGAVCSGGRYDGLVEHLGGRATPAVGWAMGIERAVELLEVQRIGSPTAGPRVYLVAVGYAAGRAGLQLAERLRDELPGLRIELHGGGGGFKAQMRRADRSGAELALILGDEEVAGSKAGLKALRSDSAQIEVAWSGLAGAIAERLEQS